jgi:DNA-directed RNA polymerase subunit H (RpoH/RPB5)
MATADPLRCYSDLHRAVNSDKWDTVERILTTCKEMLQDRGCERVVQTDDLLQAVQEMTPVVSGRGGEQIDVYMSSEERVGVKYARTVLDRCEAEGVRCIVISPEGATPFTRKECDGKSIQFFSARNVCFNVTHHALVPKHERVDPPSEGTAHLPRILETDSVIQYYGWPVGSVVRVLRVFGGHEPVPFLRVVSAAIS